MPSGRKRGLNTTAWHKVRLAVLERDNWQCQIALPGEWITHGRSGREHNVRHCLGRADCVHHTRGAAVSTWDMRYLVAACTPCNLKIGDPTAHDPEATVVTDWFSR